MPQTGTETQELLNIMTTPGQAVFFTVAALAPKGLSLGQGRIWLCILHFKELMMTMIAFI